MSKLTAEQVDQMDEVRLEIAMTLGKIHAEWSIPILDLLTTAVAEIAVTMKEELGPDLAAMILRTALEKVEARS